MQKLLLFSRIFPFSNSEPYLETEINYYEKFDEVHIFSLSVLDNDVLRELTIPQHIKIHRISFHSKLEYIFNSLKFIFKVVFYKELFVLLKSKRFSITNIVALFIFLSRANYDMQDINKIIEEENIINEEDDIFLYSYRLDYSALIVADFERKSKKTFKISRAHGIDLYEFRQSGKYIPLREYIIDELDEVHFISKQGLNYMKDLYPFFNKKYFLSYLGTQFIEENKSSKSIIFKVVSCSNVIDIKQIPLLYEALQLLDFKIEWTHYGTGNQFLALQELVKGARNGLKVNLLGGVSNKKIMNDYQNLRYDLFINVSQTEGLPVSIMEAFSAGIPAIATDVGGTSEILENEVNGFLLPPNVDKKLLATQIKLFKELNFESQNLIRKNARITWENKFYADKNYKYFINNLIERFNEE